jgi:hypothetical protein
LFLLFVLDFSWNFDPFRMQNAGIIMAIRTVGTKAAVLPFHQCGLY